MKPSFSGNTSPAVRVPNRFAGIRALAHDADERQTREDREYGQTFFTRCFTLMRGPPVIAPAGCCGRRPEHVPRVVGGLDLLEPRVVLRRVRVAGARASPRKFRTSAGRVRPHPAATSWTDALTAA